MRKQAIAAAVMVVVFAGPASAQAQTPSPTPTPQPGAEKFEKVTLNDFPGEPMNLAVLPDGRVLHTARTGEIRIHDPATGINTLAATLDVYQHDEEGLQSVAVDPNFLANKWVYAYYSPPQKTPADNPATPGFNEGDAPDNGTPADWQRFKGVIRLSRFKLKGDKLDLDTEQKIIDVGVDRGQCCHVGGNIDFDLDGNLYLSTGDDTNPFASDGYSPLDDSPTRNPVYDARRSAGNSNDLRGKILRIKPKKSKPGYTVPDGNLFKKGRAKTRPEIYAMGLRNPFRFGMNRETGDLYVGDYSPDAEKPDAARGPAGHGRWIIIKKPANYGWPYCVTPTLAYNDYDFATKLSGPRFDCKAPKNDSPYNTGLSTLPAVARPDVWYSYVLSPHFPALDVEGPEGNGGIAPMGGPAYEPIRGNKSPFRFPNSYAGKPLFYEWSRDWTKQMELNKQGRLDEIDGFAPFVDNPIDMEFGPDGSLYVLEYGDGYFAENPDAQLSKINYVRNNRSPVAKIQASSIGGRAPLTVQFQSTGTVDPDGDSLSLAWDFNGDGKVDSRKPNPSYTLHQERRLPRDGQGDRRDRPRGERRGADRDRQPDAGARADHDPEAERPGSAVQVRPDDHLRGPRHRRRTRGLREGHRVLRARSRSPRPPAELHGGLLGDHHRPARKRPRRGGGPQRDPRRVLHRRGCGRPARTERHRAGAVLAGARGRIPPAPLDRRRHDPRGPALQLGRGGRRPGVRARPARELGRPLPQRRVAQRPPHREPHAPRRAEPRREPHAHACPVHPRGVLGHVAGRGADQHGDSRRQRPRHGPVAAVGDHEIAVRHRLGVGHPRDQHGVRGSRARRVVADRDHAHRARPRGPPGRRPGAGETGPATSRSRPARPARRRPAGPPAVRPAPTASAPRSAPTVAMRADTRAAGTSRPSSASARARCAPTAAAPGRAARGSRCTRAGPAPGRSTPSGRSGATARGRPACAAAGRRSRTAGTRAADPGGRAGSASRPARPPARRRAPARS